MERLIPISLLIFILLGLAPQQDRGWKGIVPLHSTRTGVEQAIGKATNKNNNQYETTSEIAVVYYSETPCVDGWNVPPNTVIYLFVFPKKKPRVSDLQINTEKYRKEIDTELPGVYYLRNDEERTSIEVTEELVTGFYYGPARRDNHLRCKR